MAVDPKDQVVLECNMACTAPIRGYDEENEEYFYRNTDFRAGNTTRLKREFFMEQVKLGMKQTQMSDDKNDIWERPHSAYFQYFDWVSGPDDLKKEWNKIMGASEIPAQEPPDATVDIPADAPEVAELRAKAKALGIKGAHNMKPETLQQRVGQKERENAHVTAELGAR
jgi:hypothetical protein